MIRKLALVGMILGLAACGPRYDVAETAVPVTLGETQIEIVVYEAEAPGLSFINLHENEATSVEAARAFIGEHGGRLVMLRHTGERHVQFVLDDSTYVFDPNRIFTDAGRAATLDTLGAYSEAAHARVTALADTLLARYQLDRLPVILAVHNNTDDNYSTLSYLPDGTYAAEALFTHLSDEHDPDDFFFVTDRALYDALRAKDFNVVLQDNALATDDGSLSVFAGQQGRAYVNIEAQHGHAKQQRRMFEALRDIEGLGGGPVATREKD